jgi:hypothetical protein
MSQMHVILNFRRLSHSEHPNMREAPKFAYDMAFDLKALQNALKSASFLQDSGYRSQVMDTSSSVKPACSTSAMTTSCHLYGTG